MRRVRSIASVSVKANTDNTSQTKMTVFLFADLPALAAPQVIFTVLVAIMVLLSLRTWNAVKGPFVSRRIEWQITGIVLALLILFLVLVA